MKIIKTIFPQQILRSSQSSLSSLPLPPTPDLYANASTKMAYPCGVCYKSVNDNHNAVLCDICDKWIHIKCNLLNSSDYKKLKNAEETFYCINCTKDITPFSNMNNNEFFTTVLKGVLNTENKIFDIKPSEYQQNLFNRLNSYINNNNTFLTADNDDDDNDFIQQSVDCKNTIV